MSDQKRKNSIIDHLPTMTRNALASAGYTDETLKLASDAELLRLPFLGRVGLASIRESIIRPQPRAVLHQANRDRLWLAGTVASGILAGNTMHEDFVAQRAVRVANLILEELEKFNV